MKLIIDGRELVLEDGSTFTITLEPRGLHKFILSDGDVILIRADRYYLDYKEPVDRTKSPAAIGFEGVTFLEASTATLDALGLYPKQGVNYAPVKTARAKWWKGPPMTIALDGPGVMWREPDSPTDQLMYQDK